MTEEALLCFPQGYLGRKFILYYFTIHTRERKSLSNGRGSVAWVVCLCSLQKLYVAQPAIRGIIGQIKPKAYMSHKQLSEELLGKSSRKQGSRL